LHKDGVDPTDCARKAGSNLPQRWLMDAFNESRQRLPGKLHVETVRL